MVRVTSRRGPVEAPVYIDRALRAGMVFMTLHFPDDVATNLLTINATDPQVGHGRVQGVRGARRAGPYGGDCRTARRSESSRGGRRRLMDLHLRHAAPTDDERAAVDALLGPPRSALGRRCARRSTDAHCAHGGREAREQRHLLLPALQALQARVGWISETGLEYVCARLGVPPADAWGVATFYALLVDDAARAARAARLRRHRLSVPRARRS